MVFLPLVAPTLQLCHCRDDTIFFPRSAAGASFVDVLLEGLDYFCFRFGDAKT